MRRIRTPSGMRCQTNRGKFTRCPGKKRKGATRRKKRGGFSGLCRTRAGKFSKCRKGMKRA